MKNKKILLGIGVVLGLAIAAIMLSFVWEKDTGPDAPSEHIAASDINQEDIATVDKTQYSNLVFHDFETNLEAVEGVYNIEILTNYDYEDRTFLENFAIMNDVIDKFFLEDFDKSYIVADFYPENEERIDVYYNDIESVCVDEKFNTPGTTFLFGNNTKEGGYMVQIDEALRHTWFSKYAFGDIGPHGGLDPDDDIKTYLYVSCVRQVEDVEIHLQDGKINLSEMEARVLTFLNENFPLGYSEHISFGIGDARIINNGDYEGVCFKVRRIYKGIPFEYGSVGGWDIYRDEVGHDSGEITYAVSSSPDTMMSFYKIDGTIVETQTITEMITMEEAVELLSKDIGENSVYDVYGVELVYRECEIPEERQKEVDEILRPMWKFITINQNDSKYTLFYVDVVTGEITERFEYYYE